jgi:cell fate regulator YaaT (PSP1 superfamily)
VIVESIRHDVAREATPDILSVFNLRDEEKLDAFERVCERVKQGLLACDQESKDRLQRLDPQTN